MEALPCSPIDSVPRRLGDGKLREDFSAKAICSRFGLRAFCHQRRQNFATEARMVGATGIEPVTPAMSTQCSYR